jgi:2,3-dihydroxybenzoate decarboxylase
VKRIAIEEHCLTDYFLEYLQQRKEYPRLESVMGEEGPRKWRWWDSAEEYTYWLPEAVVNKYAEIGDNRLQYMDEAGIDMQVLSFNYNIDQLNAADAMTLTRKINDRISEAVKKYPDRFVGFAAVALKDPKATADEFERAVTKLGFKGTMILPHVNGEFIDAKKYWPIYERAAKLDVPVYIHPMFPPPERFEPYLEYPDLSGAMWGFGAEAGLAVMRLICSGIFDEYPNLTIILGHLGEALPFWMWRLDNSMIKAAAHVHRSSRDSNSTANIPLVNKLKRLPSEYFRDNFYVTTSGMLWQPALVCAELAIGADRILFSADYPFESSKDMVEFIESSAISENDKEKVFHINAERLLKL